MKVQILGAGAVGACFGGQLARAGHEVTCFARGANLAALRERGLEIRSPEGTLHVPMMTTDRPEMLSAADFAILAVKSYSLAELAPVARHCAAQGTPVVSLLNGVETAERLQEAGVPGTAIIGGIAKVSAVRVAPGVVERRSPFQSVVLGELDGRSSDRVGRIVAAFRDAGLDARSSERIVVELWEKFIFISAVAAACGLTRSPIGPVRADPLGRRLVQRAIEEAVAVGRARGVPLPGDAAARAVTAIDSLPPATKPSFLVDLEAGGPNELDILSGAVSRLAESSGIPTPVHDTVTVVLGNRFNTPGERTS
jgi:2-dehydropantoate 2-reductase